MKHFNLIIVNLFAYYEEEIVSLLQVSCKFLTIKDGKINMKKMNPTCNLHCVKVSKYGVFSGPNTGKYGPEKTPYLDTFHVVLLRIMSLQYGVVKTLCNAVFTFFRPSLHPSNALRQIF